MSSESRHPAVETAPADGEPLPLAYAPPELLDEPELPPSVRLRRISVVAMAMGLGIWVAGWSGQTWGDGMDYALMAVLPVALIGPLRRRFVAALDRIRQPSPGARSLIACITGILAALLAYGQALRIGRELTPHWHDEHSYLLQAVHLSQFKLWVTPPPGWPADFFESFHIFTEPVYASVYWPGAALMNVPGQWLGLPSFVMPLVIYGATVAMIYLLTARLLDGVAGLLAVMLATTVLEYYSFSTRIMAQVPTALLGAWLIWAWLRWREALPDRRLRWVALMGVFAGWLGITRPVDGLAFALPVAVTVVGTIVIDFVRRRRAEAADAPLLKTLLAPLARTIVVGILFTLPFLGLQVAFNYGTTGNPLLPPYVSYFERYHPGFKYASAGVVDRTDLPSPQTTLPQKLKYYEKFIAPSGVSATRNSAWEELAGWRLPTLLGYSFPGRNFFGFGMVGVAVALGLYGLLPARTPRVHVPLRVMAAVIGCFLAFYVYNPLFLTHYSITLAVVTLPLAAIGLRAVEECAGPRMRPVLVVLISGAVLAWFAYSVWDYPSIYRAARTEVTFRNEEVPKMIDGKALVLVRYMPRSNIHNEPVYNSEVAWPDEARIVWAHELGSRTAEILRYYAQHQSDRDVYLMVRPTHALYPMGPVKEALALFEAGRWPLPPLELTAAEAENRPGSPAAEWRRNLPPPIEPKD